MIILTSFWNSTIAGGFYGFLSAMIIFLLTTWYNEVTRKKALKRELLITFFQASEELLSVIENIDYHNIDYQKIRNATNNLQLILLNDGQLKENLIEFKKIIMLKGDKFREEKGKLPRLLKEIYDLLKKQKDELL